MDNIGGISRASADEARCSLSGRQGLGGPQPQEVKRMLTLAREALEADRVWLVKRRDQIASAEAKLNQAFTKLLP